MVDSEGREPEGPSDGWYGIEPTATPLCLAISRFYSRGEDGKFKEANLAGILCFLVDRKLKSRFLRLYDINTSELIFQTELFINVAQHYQKISEKFYVLPLVKTVIGIEFANLNDALFMRKLMTSMTFCGDAKQLVKEERKRHGIVSYRLSRPTIFVRK